MQANFVLNENPDVISSFADRYPISITSTVQSCALLNVALLQCAHSPLSPQKNIVHNIISVCTSINIDR